MRVLVVEAKTEVITIIITITENHFIPVPVTKSVYICVVRTQYITYENNNRINFEFSIVAKYRVYTQLCAVSL